MFSKQNVRIHATLFYLASDQCAISKDRSTDHIHNVSIRRNRIAAAS